MEVATQTPDKLWVRINPFKPAQGFTKKTFIVSGHHMAFNVDAGWYEVDAPVAVQLRKFKNNPNDPTSPPIFQIVTREKAMELDQRAKIRAAEATAPNRIASNALQGRREIPKPIVFPSDPTPAVAPTGAKTPAAPVASSVPGMQEDLRDVLAEVLDEQDMIETDDEIPVGGDLTTQDLAPAVKPVAIKTEAKPIATRKPTKR